MYELVEPQRVMEQLNEEEVIHYTKGLKQQIREINDRRGKIVQFLRYDHEYDFLILVEYPDV